MNSKPWILVALAILSFVSGCAGQYLHGDKLLRPTIIAFVVIGSFLIFAWYVVDTRQSGYRRRPLSNVAMIALPIIALPIYFFRTRGFRGGLIATALFLVTVFAMNFLHVLGQHAVYHTLQS